MNGYDASVIELVRRVLDDVLNDERFFAENAISTIELAEHVLAEASLGQRDPDRLRASAFSRFKTASNPGKRSPDKR